MKKPGVENFGSEATWIRQAVTQILDLDNSLTTQTPTGVWGNKAPKELGINGARVVRAKDAGW